MNLFSGRVVQTETDLGVPGVVVVLYDVDPGTEPEEAIPAPVVTPPPLPVAVAPAAVAVATAPGDRIGSRITDATGAFEFQYDDAEFQIRNPAEKRPDLLVEILAPEDPGSTPESRNLLTSVAVVANAGRTEEAIFRIPGAVLTKAGIPLPLDPATAKQEPEAAAGTMRQAMDYHTAVTTEVRTIAAQQVEVSRQAAQQTDALVESRLVQSLTGVTPEQAARLNIVPPASSPAATVWSTVNRTIEDTVNATTIAGYVVLTDAEAQQFRDAAGNYRDHIPAAEIEPYIFQATDEKRPITIIRADPAAALCRAATAPDPSVPAGGGNPAPASGNGAGPAADDQPLTAQNLPTFIGRLLAPLVAADGSGPGGRPTAADVESSIQALQLGGGPADVTAFYDFHQLQLAFDYVWQQAIDDGVLETGKTLCRQLQDQGGDPVAALQAGGDPLKALRDEVVHVTAAQQSLQSAGVTARMAPNGHGSDGGGSGPAPQPPPTTHVPTIVRPPFIGPAILDPDTSAEPADLLAELEEMLSERYSFQVFAPGSTNFGLLVTYRQRWDPITYQVGNLVKTVTLAPKETRKATSKRTIRVERSVKEMQDNQRNRKDETKQTMRDEAEIVRRAQDKNNFSLSAKGSYDIGIAGGDSTTTLGRDAESASQETKRSFMESVLSAAQELRDETKLEVETKTSEEDETTESIELTNPNDELTVTYLFYELQRRYRVSQHIHRLTPVVLVAMEVPNPNRDAIDKVLLAHSWIVNRVLLDDRYRPALDYLCTRVVGDQMALQDLANNVAQVAAAVRDLQTLYRNMEIELSAREAALQSAMEARAADVGKKDSGGILSSAEDWVFGSDSGSDPQAAQILEDAAKDAYERAVQEEKDLRMRLDAETAALSAATTQYAKARAEHGNWLLQIAALRAHFKENVLFYMQAIWSYTFRDQIFFSLCNVSVPKLTAAQKTYSLKVPDHIPLSVTPKPGQVVLEVDADVQLNTNLDPTQDFVTLAEVADLDSPLGFKGNYMIFPLRQSNPLTDFMMIPYVDSELGIHDPDELGSWTPEDFAQYARCLQEQLKDQISASDYAALQSQLKAQYAQIVGNPQVPDDMVIIPTSSLYIEALPGAHPLLENFKLEHRAIDVQKAKAEASKAGMEALRYADRLLNAQLGDPEIEKQIVVDNAVAGVTVSDT